MDSDEKKQGVADNPSLAAHYEYLVQMGHEIRNPLSGMAGLLVALEETNLTGEQREIVSSIALCTRRVTSLCNGLVDHAKLDARLRHAVDGRRRDDRKRLNPSSRVAIVDDLEYNRLGLRAILKCLGLDVTILADGVEGLKALKRDGCDLLLIDSEMPQLSGIEAVAAFRSVEAEGPKAIVIGTTGHTGREHEEACLEAGMDAVLIKPIEPESLASLLCTLGALHLPAGALGSRRQSVGSELPLDLEMLRLAGGRHPGGFAAQVDAFIAGMEGELVAARSVFERGTCAEVHNAAHSLLSLCNVVRYEPMSALARNMEAQSGANDRESLNAHLGRLEQQFAIVRSLLLEIRNADREGISSPASQRLTSA